MVCNVGKVDRLVRTLIAIILIIWGITAKYLFMLIIGVSLLFTALSGWCIIYALLKLDTGCKKKKN